MPSEQSTKLAEAVQILRGSVGETEQLVADLTDALANALVERDALQKRLDVVIAQRDATIKLGVLVCAMCGDRERDALQARLDAVIAKAEESYDGAPCRSPATDIARKLCAIAEGEE